MKKTRWKKRSSIDALAWASPYSLYTKIGHSAQKALPVASFATSFCGAAMINFPALFLEDWPSGRRRTLGKRVRGQLLRGFESLVLRHFYFGGSEMRYLYLLILIVALFGCSTTTKISNAETVPEERFYLNTKPIESSSAELVVWRDNSLSGSSCFYAIYLDDKLAARVASSEKVSFKLSPGKVNLKVSRDPMGEGLCSYGDDSIEKLIGLKGSDKKYIQLSMGISGWPKLKSIHANIRED
jgi:hypothetical protein